MEWHEIEVDGQHTVKFTDLPYVPLTSPSESVDDEQLLIGKKHGGILRHGEWSWLARNSVLQIVSLRNGQTISSYEFSRVHGYECCCIKFVEELFPNNPEIMLLAVVLESFRTSSGGCSYVAVYSVELSSVLNSTEINLHLTCARFMEASSCRRSLLQNFDGCLAVGSEEGVIALLDMNLRKLRLMHNELQEDIFVPCHIVDYSLPLTEIHRNFRQCQQDGIHFGLQMEVIESPCSIRCIQPIDLILGLAIGLEDGRLALYDLTELQIFYVALPYPEVTMSALVKMDFLEPLDDPRPCLFIWTLHENGENLRAVMHSLMYEKRIVEEDGSLTHFESFQASSVRLQLPLEATKSKALSCQAVSTLSTHSEDDSNSLCVISWLSILEGKNKLLIFDLNQWYKEEMPHVLEYGKQPNYLAGYILNGECTGLHTLLNPNSIAHFNSIQRVEEHFYPNSLSFEVFLLHTEGCRRYNWEGAQNKVINFLRSSNAAIFLEPNLYFNEIIRVRLMPQFIELNIDSAFSRNAKYEVLLSAALEHNCISLLRDCAKSWIDGSFMGNFSASTGLSLSTLTDWIWKRATCIKSRCNDLCKNLFEFGGYPLDNREQKELGFITRQLKLLSDLLKEILMYAKKQVPEKVLNDLESKQSSLSMAYSYQNVLLWLINIGLLPEASANTDKINASNDLVPYPYKELKQFYRDKRLFFGKINETFVSKKSGSCKLLFIDSFIEHVCKGNILQEYWLENEGNGLYPPATLEAMLRVMLVPDLSYDNKCAILLYFFLDLNMTINEEIYKNVVENFIKFPSVFKLTAPLIKTVQAFWNLDHDHYLPAVDEFISPFNKNQSYPQWQVELFIEVLLNHKASNLALRILESQSSLISPLLKLRTLLANEQISEAFHFVRSKNDDALLETFFACCLGNSKFGVIRDLALSEREGLILQNVLKRSKAPGAESLHFVYLLQKSKYIEAVSYMEELSNKAKGLKSSMHQGHQMDTPNMVLSAFNTTMTPVTQGLTDVYFRIKSKLKKKEVDNKSPVPLSCQLIKQNANGLLGGIYHSSALSAHFATYYWGEMEEQTKQTKYLLNSNNAPFLRKPQIDTNSIDYLAKNKISYPQAYKVTEKRTLVESGVLEDNHDEYERHKIEHKLNPKKKRRLIGQEIVDDLSHFMKMNKTTISSNASEFSFGPEPAREPDESTRNSLDLMSRPLMTKSVAHDKGLDGAATSVSELHGILKTHTPDPGQQQREPLAEEEKNLRFTLPSGDVGPVQVRMEVAQIKDASKVLKNVEEEKQEEEINSGLLNDTPKFKRTTRAVSEESNKSSVGSINVSEENFYSPLSSQNSSKLDCSKLSSYSFLSGPQPRKPLARLSAERSEKSLTPEAKVTDSSLMINSRSSNYATAIESDLTSKVSPINSTERLNIDPLDNSAAATDFGSKERNKSSYVTAIETLTQPKTFSSTNLEEITETTSGYGSASHAAFAVSKISEFVPKISSSKVGTTPIKTNADSKSPSAPKLSECSTVLGTLTTFECTNTGSNIANTHLDKTTSYADLNKPTEEQKRQMLETTLSMSTYDISIFDSTSVQQTTSVLTATTKLVEKANKKIVCEEVLEESKYDSEQKTENVSEMEKQPNSPEMGESSKCDFIVLSSSSSSSSTEELEENESTGNYSDYEMDEDVEIDNEGNNDDDENSDFGESNESYSNLDIKESDMSNEDIKEDYDEEFINQKLYSDERDNFSDIENDDVVQLIEDSSSDVGHQEANYYSESDSNDVTVVEDEQLPLATDSIGTPISEEPKTEITIKKDKVKDAEFSEENNVETIPTAIDKSSSMQANQFENNDSNLTKNKEELPTSTKNSSDADTQIIEVVSISATKISTESKSEDLKQHDMDANTYIKQEELSDSKDISSTGTDIKLYEDNQTQSADSRKHTEIIKITEPTENVFKIETSSEDLEKQIEKTFEKGFTTDRKSEVNIETEAIGETIEKSEDLGVRELSSSDRDHTATETQLTIQKTPVNKVGLKNSDLSIEKDDKSEKNKNELKDKEDLNVKQIENASSVSLVNTELTSVEIQITTPKPGDKIKEKSKFIMEKDVLFGKTEDEIGKKIKETENESASSSKKNKRRTLRGSSVPPLDREVCVVTEFSSPRRNKRDISLPPQTVIESEELFNLTPRTRRNIGASSLQPKYKMEKLETNRPYKEQDPKCTEMKRKRGSSMPPAGVDGKISTRRRSVILDAINEDPAMLDSPSRHTRLRSRLSSMDSEVDSPVVSTTEQLVQQKRALRLSNSSIELTETPKRIRRTSTSSQPETSAAVTTPRSLRGRSVLSVQEEDSESIPASPQPSSNKRFEVKRKKNYSEEHTNVSKEHVDQISPKSDQSAASQVAYSSSRRLTRTQLAIMQKSTALSQALIEDTVSSKEAISPPPTKRSTKQRYKRSSTVSADSDDAESVSSKLSTASSLTGTRRRVTRSSVKGKDDVEDDEVSIASSLGSEKQQRTLRSKDKSSPNTTLATIPEDEPAETMKRERASKN